MRKYVFGRQIRLLIALVFLSVMAIDDVQVSFAYDRTDRIYQDQSSTFAPGYINITKRKTDLIIAQTSPVKKNIIASVIEGTVNFIFGRDSREADNKNKVNENAVQLKRKSSRGGEQSQIQPSETRINYDVNIGSGTDRNAEGRLLYESINGIRHVYVGFDNAGYGTITEAMANAKSGDILVVKAGTYGDGESFSYFDGVSMVSARGVAVRDGVKMYGGYDENGMQNFGDTILNGTFYINNATRETVINGFTVAISGTVTIRNDQGESIDGNVGFYANNSSNVKLYNNSIKTGSMISQFSATTGLVSDNSKVEIKNNTFDTFYGVTAFGDRGSNISSNYNNFNGIFGGMGLWGMYASGTNSSVSSQNDYYKISDSNRTVNFENAAASLANPSNRPNTDRASLIVPTGFSANTLVFQPFDTNRFLDEKMSKALMLDLKNGEAMSTDMLPSLMSNLLKEKNNMAAKGSSEFDPALLAKLAVDSLEKFALAAPIALAGGPNVGENEIALLLAKIIKNPTEEQKKMLDTIESLMEDTNKVKEETGSKEVEKASNDLIRAMTAALVAQAIPDLLKEGDTAAIKGIFAELNIRKAKIILEYQQGIKPYYDQIIKEITKNIAILQSKGIISTGLSEKELRRMNPSQINEILDKIRKSENKTFDEQYILQQEAKLKKKYIDSSKKKLEENMKNMLKGYTNKLYFILGSADVIKQKPAKSTKNQN